MLEQPIWSQLALHRPPPCCRAHLIVHPTPPVLVRPPSRMYYLYYPVANWPSTYPCHASTAISQHIFVVPATMHPGHEPWHPATPCHALARPHFPVLVQVQHLVTIQRLQRGKCELIIDVCKGSKCTSSSHYACLIAQNFELTSSSTLPAALPFSAMYTVAQRQVRHRLTGRLDWF